MSSVRSCALAGSIPAWAGETNRHAASVACGGVYPRVGGGNCRIQDKPNCMRGLSPRGRGKPLLCAGGGNPDRSIPAWAGETVTLDSFIESIQVYPRVGGGNRRTTPNSPTQKGLSPRGRGKLLVGGTREQCYGSIPAWAGETGMLAERCTLWRVYPRVGGGNRPQCRAGMRPPGLSPRGRGKRRRRWVAFNPGRVYPRVGGGNG